MPLVTGGARVGAGMAAALTEAGARVMIADVLKGVGEQTAAELPGGGFVGRCRRATAEASLHGWHHTGDIGYLDDDNYLFSVDRAKDMIVTGGFNVYSAEVEPA